MAMSKISPTLRTVLIVIAAVIGLALLFFIIGLIDVSLEKYNPHWIVKLVLVALFLGVCAYLDKDSKTNGDDE